MITVITGPPCSGKSTYVREHAQPGDIIIDFDKLAQAMSISPLHDAPDNIRWFVARVRWRAINEVLRKPSPAWIIDSAPKPDMLERYKAAQARIVLLDPGRDECHRRALADKRPDWTPHAIDRWYGKTQHTVRASRSW